MSAWAAKRFWTTAEAAVVEGGFGVVLDGRPVRTPLKAPMTLPTRAMAEAIAAEWQAQQGLVKPETMPCTRAANAALDKVTAQFDEVVELLAAYGDSDLICYRATHPAALIARQAAAWDPMVDWAARALEAPLRVVSGVVHVPQDPETLARLHARTAALTPFQLTAFHDLVSISGSLILAFAVTRRHLSAEEAWNLSRIDETWQAELWGEDAEASESEGVRRAGLLQAGRFWDLCG